MSPPLDAAERAVLGDRVSCDAEMGISWQRIDALPDAAVLSRHDIRNGAVLRALSMFEEHDETQSDDAERAEFHRLEGKMDLALELLVELVRQRKEQMEPAWVRFNASGLCWDSPTAFEGGELLAVECHPVPAWPVPLRLHVQVSDASSRDGRWRICGRIVGLGQGARLWLEKLVFRRHRRSVAQQRTRS